LNTDNSKIGPWSRDLLDVQFKYLFSVFLGLSATIPSSPTTLTEKTQKKRAITISQRPGKNKSIAPQQKVPEKKSLALFSFTFHPLFSLAPRFITVSKTPLSTALFSTTPIAPLNRSISRLESGVQRLKNQIWCMVRHGGT